ncbi:MAG: hypothetical protein WA571_02025 [Candidatus Binatus sp.]
MSWPPARLSACGVVRFVTVPKSSCGAGCRGIAIAPVPAEILKIGTH